MTAAAPVGSRPLAMSVSQLCHVGGTCAGHRWCRGFRGGTAARNRAAAVFGPAAAGVDGVPLRSSLVSGSPHPRPSTSAAGRVEAQRTGDPLRLECAAGSPHAAHRDTRHIETSSILLFLAPFAYRMLMTAWSPTHSPRSCKQQHRLLSPLARPAAALCPQGLAPSARPAAHPAAVLCARAGSLSWGRQLRGSSA